MVLGVRLDITSADYQFDNKSCRPLSVILVFNGLVGCRVHPFSLLTCRLGAQFCFLEEAAFRWSSVARGFAAGLQRKFIDDIIS
jgi:hypothetical protein